MNTRYRVDVNNARVVPCGMSGLHYLGDDWESACKAFDETPAGIDKWDLPTAGYGVILSVWDFASNEYVIKKTKGL